MDDLKLNTFGVILEGEFNSWCVFIEDDSKNTGGYLILLSPSLSKENPMGFDVWVENIQDVQQCVTEKKWKIKWLTNPDSKKLG